jgi:hypothetical protein
MDKFEQLAKLAELKNNGTLTATEYETEKQKLLSGSAQSSSAANTAIVNEYWQKQFSEIEANGLGTYKKFNWAAFFFTWIWAFSKGLWQNALATLGIIVFVSIIDAMIDNPAVSSGLTIGLGIGLGMAYGQTGNKWYYRKAVKGEAVFY